MYGKCEVILYHPGHNVTLPELSLEHVEKLVDLWCSRFRELSSDPEIKYVYIFENRGAEAGVTMPHPHGQLYAFNWIPKIMETELGNAKKYYEDTGGCLICDLLKNEKKEGVRMVMENGEFAVYVPYYTAFPYGTHVVAKRHTGNMNGFSKEQKRCLADILIKLTGAYDQLFDKLFPYMMGMHQTPVNMETACTNAEDAGEYYHFHIEFYPPLRAAGTQYFRASCETGIGAYCNASSPEEKAAELREAYQKWMERNEWKFKI
jgi:UDPglucose--hexose-1-phosphate uridylyltransferase